MMMGGLGPNVDVKGALAPQGRARCVCSGNIALWLTLQGDPHWFLRSQTENKMDITCYGFCFSFPAPSLARSFPAAIQQLTPCRKHLYPAWQIIQFELDTPPRHIRRALTPNLASPRHPPRHTHAVLSSLEVFRRTLLSLPCRACERVSLYL